ncbi:nuclear transport factor 2 family protein [Shimia sp. Alg240-R146]|uniref:nuclear transport factor 2 family protein n=1 Tax=Shimia sp. Alg240-R146 TaxID=2993449 RepID=UPI0022E90CFB|nr:nuclear transport factor 2 family protein [Shimia sp. Alg240-R146]
MNQISERLQALLALETQVWNALVTGDGSADAAMLSEDFLGVYPDGFAGKEAHVGQLDGGATVADFRLSDVHLRDAGEAAALLIYRADFLRVGHDSWETMLVSSLWEKRPGGWINSFSQDTPLTGDAVV